jgi:hypothetical protein
MSLNVQQEAIDRQQQQSINYIRTANLNGAHKPHCMQVFGENHAFVGPHITQL